MNQVQLVAETREGTGKAPSRKLRREGLAGWQLGSTAEDLTKSLSQVADPRVKERLQDVLSDFEDLMPKP